MKREDIKPGFMLHLSNEVTYHVISVSGVLYVMLIASNYTSYKLNDAFNEDLSSNKIQATIKTITNEFGQLVWTKPVEMTISQIEKSLKLTPGSLRIKD